MEQVKYTFTARELILLSNKTTPPPVLIARTLKQHGFQFEPLPYEANESNTEPKPKYQIFAAPDPKTNTTTYFQMIPG